MTKDPWQAAPRPVQANRPDKLQDDTEQRIEKAILAPQERMDVDDQDSRLECFKKQMQEMSQRHVQWRKSPMATACSTLLRRNPKGQMTAHFDLQRHHLAEMSKEEMTHTESLLRGRELE